MKASDAALSPWLTSLSTFVAHAFKRYDMQLTGVLQYIANELKDGNKFVWVTVVGRISTVATIC